MERDRTHGKPPWVCMGERPVELVATRVRQVRGQQSTDYVVTLDVGHPTDVHPTDKRPVGERLARLAVRLGDPKTVAKGPEYAACERQGRQLMLRFKPTSAC